MDDLTIVMIIFAVIGAVVSSLCHLLIRFYLIASIVAAVLSSVIYQVVAYIQAGFLEPLYLMAFVNGAVVYFVIALLIGIPFAGKRKKLKGSP